VTFDFDLDLEHPGCRLTWRPLSASLVAIRPFVCEKKRFVQKFTDRQTDDGCLAIAWNELMIHIYKVTDVTD